MEHSSSGGRFAVALLLFGISLLIAVVLLLTALLVWLTQAVGSLIAATLIVGGFFALLAAVVYLIFSTVLTQLQGMLEKKLGKHLVDSRA